MLCNKLLFYRILQSSVHTYLIYTTNQDPTTTSNKLFFQRKLYVYTSKNDRMDSTLSQTVWLTSLSLQVLSSPIYPSSGCWKHRGSSHSTKSTACMLCFKNVPRTSRSQTGFILWPSSCSCLTHSDTSWHKIVLLSCCDISFLALRVDPDNHPHLSTVHAGSVS